MKTEAFFDGESYYVRGPKTALPLCWSRRPEGWSMQRQSLPAAAERVELGDLPADLKEEVLAFLARAQTVGPSMWSMSN